MSCLISQFILCEGVSNTVTQLRFLGCVFLELQYWANRVKYVFSEYLTIVNTIFA